MAQAVKGVAYHAIVLATRINASQMLPTLAVRAVLRSCWKIQSSLLSFIDRLTMNALNWIEGLSARKTGALAIYSSILPMTVRPFFFKHSFLLPFIILPS